MNELRGAEECYCQRMTSMAELLLQGVDVKDALRQEDMVRKLPIYPKSPCITETRK